MTYLELMKPWWSRLRPSIFALAVAVVVVGCGDDSPTTAPPANNPEGDAATDDGGTPDVAEEDAAREDASEDAAADTLEEDAPEDAADDVAEDVAPDLEPDTPTEGLECDETVTCDEQPGTACLDGVCTLNPESRTYVEVSYDLQEPEELAPIISTVKGLIGNTGLFMTRFSPLDDAGEMVVTYGGGDRVETVPPDGPHLYAWQIPEENLPVFRVHRYAPADEPLSYDRWESEIFDYRLIAIIEVGTVRSSLGFEAADSTVNFRFNEDLSEITTGRLDGFITRAEAESRLVELADNCILSMGICPGYDCDNDPPIGTVADILDCRGALMDSDIDPAIDGADAYRAVILFTSEEVDLQ